MPRAFDEADARTRTGDPFITSELPRRGVGCREVAGSGFPPRFRVHNCGESRFPPRALSAAFGRGLGARAR